MLISELWKQYSLTYLVYGGRYCFSFVPFQLCSVAMYLAILTGAAGLWKSLRDRCGSDGKSGNETLSALCDVMLEFLATFSLLGAVAVFLDTSGMNYELPALTVHSYLWHIAVILLGLYAGTRKRRKDRKIALASIGLYLICCGIAEIINFSLDRFDIVNMFYINPHYYMVQIVFSDLIPYIGNRAVIVLYVLTTITGAQLLHAGWSRLLKECG